MTKSPIEHVYGPNRCLKIEEAVENGNAGDLYIAEGKVISQSVTDFHKVIYIDTWKYPIFWDISAQVKIGDRVKVFGCLKKHFRDANEGGLALQAVKMRILLSVNGPNKGCWSVIGDCGVKCGNLIWNADSRTKCQSTVDFIFESRGCYPNWPEEW